ncbi:MAG: hypothetical protein ACLU3I_12460 [Acutalibacteraceae bacterium]
MADDKKTISPDVGTPTETPEQPNPAPDLADTTCSRPCWGLEELTVEEQLILEHEGQAALLKWARLYLIPLTLLPTPRWMSLPLPIAPKAEKEQRAAAYSRQGRSCPGTFRRGGGFCRRP